MDTVQTDMNHVPNVHLDQGRHALTAFVVNRLHVTVMQGNGVHLAVLHASYVMLIPARIVNLSAIIT